MPMYRTKTIAGILEPVAQQVSKLIILHEEGEDGAAMPDLGRPVDAVARAVDNLARVGNDTVGSSQDAALKADMPRSLAIVEKSAQMLERASGQLKADPYSQAGRDQLIAGSRGILQGTTSTLVTFDESQVRKICRDCKKVLDYLAISEVIETMEDLVQFVKDLSPSLSKVCQDVDIRRKDLLNPYHRDNLGQHLEQIKTLAPILICSMKIFIQILSQRQPEGGKGKEEAVENRNYLAKRMTEEITQITKILEDNSNQQDNMAFGNNMAVSSAFNMNSSSSSSRMESATFHEVLKQTNNALSSKSSSGYQNSQKLVQQTIDMGFKVAEGFEGSTKSELLSICNELDRANRSVSNVSSVESRRRLAELVSRLESAVGEAAVARIVSDLADIATPLKLFTEAVLTPAPPNEPSKRALVEQRSHGLKAFSGRLSKTANVVAYSNARNPRRAEALRHLSSQIQTLTPQLINAGTILVNYPDNQSAEENFENLRRQFADNVQSIRDICDDSVDARVFIAQTEAAVKQALRDCEQALSRRAHQSLIENSALAARLSNRLLMALDRESENSDDANLRRQVGAAGDRLKSAIAAFVRASKAAADDVENAGAADAWRAASASLLAVVQDVSGLFDDLNMYGLDSARNRRQQQQPPTQKPVNIVVTPPPPPPEIVAPPPPRPPLPQEARVPGRPPMPVIGGGGHDTDDEEGLFSREPGSNRPIHAAAHGLFQEVNKWDHTENEIVQAAKKIAYLMAHLSELVRPGCGTKKELLACARGIAEVSERITELCKELARHCTDKKIRTNLLQVCEKIPTLGTQLRVLSTVKATMMTNNVDTEEDVEAMDMLVFNAEKLNQAVRETVGAAEAASIRVRSDAGFKLKWVRKPPVW